VKRGYADTLEAAWKDHLAPRRPDAPTVVSLFAGAGGSSLGYSMAGFRHALAVEHEAMKARTYLLNFPDAVVFEGDIYDLDDDRAMELAGLDAGVLDLLDGSPPCQGFSMTKRGGRPIDDPRNKLYLQFVRFLDAFRPRAFVMENVSGLSKGKMRIVLSDILKALQGAGYAVACWLLNAMYFDVPQARQRLIFIGSRDDLGLEPTQPAPTSRPISVREAWRDVHNSTHDLAPTWIRESSGVAQVARKLRPGQNPRTVRYYNLMKIPWNKPAPTIMRISGQSVTIAGPVHPDQMRRPTIKEVKRLCSFPDEFVLPDKFRYAWECLGDAVPPLMMRAIARHVRASILEV